MRGGGGVEKGERMREGEREREIESEMGRGIEGGGNGMRENII